MGSVTLKYLRAGGVVCATIKMRNNNDHPVKIVADVANPLDHDWDNFAEMLWKFAVHYLASEGLTETSAETRGILVYIFHGQYLLSRTVRKKQVHALKPIIHALHFKLTANRSRFVNDVDLHFQQLYELLDKHPEWDKFLDDQAEGVAPRALLIAVEVGIRSYAFSKKAKLTMGVGANKVVSRLFYKNIDAWRKMESYITGVRFHRGKTSYRKWEDFLWADFVERNKLAITFTKRHLPLSDGEDHFGGELKDPPQWTMPGTLPSKTKHGKRHRKIKIEPRVRGSAPKKFDPTTGTLIDLS